MHTTILIWKELLTLAKTSRDLLKATKKHFESWPENIEKISKKYKFDLSSDINKANLDSNIFKHIINKRAFQLSNEKSNLIQFLFDGKYRYFALANKETWAWFNDDRYWKKIKLGNSTLGIESYELLDVCWLDLNLNFQNVRPGKYKVFLRQGLREYDNMKNQCNLKIFIKSNYANDNNTNTDGNNNSAIENKIFECNFMDNEMHALITNKNRYFKNEKKDSNPISIWEEKYILERISNENQLMDYYVTTIEIPEVMVNVKEDLDIDFTVIIRFFQITGDWKSGWLIDSGILQKIDWF